MAKFVVGLGVALGSGMCRVAAAYLDKSGQPRALYDETNAILHSAAPPKATDEWRMLYIETEAIAHSAVPPNQSGEWRRYNETHAILHSAVLSNVPGAESTLYNESDAFLHTAAQIEQSDAIRSNELEFSALINGWEENVDVPSNHSPPVDWDKLYDESTALLNYRYALASFCTKEAIEQWSCGPLCKELPIVPTSARFIGPGANYGVQGYAALLPGSDRSCVVGFRGTQAKNAGNLRADAEGLFSVSWPFKSSSKDASSPANRASNASNLSWCHGCRVNKGFARAHHELQDEIHSRLEELDCKSAQFVGHSLGSGVAALAAMEVRHSLPKLTVPAPWLYGTPRVGNAQFVATFVADADKQGVKPAAWRVVHYHDFFVRIGVDWWFWGPRHLPLEVYYTEQNYTTWWFWGPRHYTEVTEPHPSPYRICPPSTTNPSDENRTCSYVTPAWQWSVPDHMMYFGVDFEAAVVNTECGFQPGVKTVGAEISDGCGGLVLLLCACCFGLCPCCRACRGRCRRGSRISPDAMASALQQSLQEPLCGEFDSMSTLKLRAVV